MILKKTMWNPSGIVSFPRIYPVVYRCRACSSWDNEKSVMKDLATACNAHLSKFSTTLEVILLILLTRVAYIDELAQWCCNTIA